MFLFSAFLGVVAWAALLEYTGLSVSPDGRLIVVTTTTDVTVYGTEDGKVAFREYGAPYGYQPYDGGRFSRIEWAPDGIAVAIGKLHGGVWVWDHRTWQQLTTWNGDEDDRRDLGVSWSPDSSKLALGTRNGQVWVWDRKTDEWIQEREGDPGLTAITYDEAGRIIAISDDTIRDVSTGDVIQAMNDGIDGIGAVSWSPHRDHVFVQFDLGGTVYDARENEQEFGAGLYPSFAWSADGRYVASAEYCSHEIIIWDLTNEKQVETLDQGTMVYALAWTPKGELLALGLRGLQTSVWNTATGETLLDLYVPPRLACVLHVL